MHKLLRLSLYTAVFVLFYLPYTSAMPRRGSDSNYVRSFPGTVTVRAFVGEKISTFDLTDGELGQHLQYRPNNNLAIGGGITIYGIGLNFSTSLPFHDEKTDLYGETRKLDIQVHRYSRKLMLDAYVQRYRGFHLADKSDVTAITGPEEYPYFPDLRALTIGVTGLFVFNGDHYSLRTITNQQEWQLRSAGSALLGASIFSHLFSDDRGILPKYYKYPDFFGGHHPKEIHYYGLTVNGGYGYTLVIDRASHYFIAGAADVGAGPGYSSVTDINGEHLDHITICLTTNMRVGAGYNSEKWFAGVYGIYHIDRYPLHYAQSALGTSQGIARFVIARRLSTKKRFLAKQPARQELPQQHRAAEEKLVQPLPIEVQPPQAPPIPPSPVEEKPIQPQPVDR